MRNRYHIQFPAAETTAMAQDEVYFNLIREEEPVQLRFHDYDRIYEIPGLYEQLFYDRLKCTSPRVVADNLKSSVESVGECFSELRVLDLGAGNGMMAEELNKCGVARLVGTDIIPEARDAAYRDRPHAYDDYLVADFTRLASDEINDLHSWNFNCLTCVAALGFGDIPPAAFFRALQLVRLDGWAAFNIKDSFLAESDKTGFSRFIRSLIYSEYLEIHHMERYRHRLSMEGTPLFYYSLVARKKCEIPASFMTENEFSMFG